MARILSRLVLIRINQRTVESHGGQFIPPDNLLNSSALDYLVEAVEAEYFGQEMYPSIADKAAVYLFSIVGNHIFQDGNKRTGLSAAIAFLFINGFDIKVPDGYRHDPSIEEGWSIEEQFVFDFTIEVASGMHGLEDVRNWFAQCTVERMTTNPAPAASPEK